MITCPDGHQTASDDFCDVCGIRIGAPSLTETSLARDVAGQGNGASAPAEACPRCGAPRVGQFCEACGYSFAGTASPPSVTAAAPLAAPAPPAPPTAMQAPVAAMHPPAAPAAPAAPAPAAGWTAVVTADRAYYESVRAAGGPDIGDVTFPAYCPERRFRLSGTEVRVGRRSVSRGIDPEIDLTGPPTDPGVSRLHVVLVVAADGTWSVIDPGSENGTLVNGNEVPQSKAVPLRDGDRIHLGAWTALTITRGV
jgi:FHA domain